MLQEVWYHAANSLLLVPHPLSHPFLFFPSLFAPIQSNTALFIRKYTHTVPQCCIPNAFHQTFQHPYPRIQNRTPSSQEAIASETKIRLFYYYNYYYYYYFTSATKLCIILLFVLLLKKIVLFPLVFVE